jgi:hypothetical protein
VTGAHGWIGYDLDGTLAITGNVPYHAIGAPIPLMVARAREDIAAGKDVRIMTARASAPVPGEIRAIEAWCLQHLGRVLPVTCSKDYGMVRLYDDRAVAVEPNTGVILGGGVPCTT